MVRAHWISLVVSSLLVVAVAAQARGEPPPITDERPQGRGIYIPIDESSGSVIQKHAGSHIIYANRCKPNCVISPGGDDSRQDRSSIVQGTRTIPEYGFGDDSWQAMMACLEDLYSPFDVIVTDEDPGPDVPHFEAIVAGRSGDAGFPGGVLGVAPFSCGVIENAITFTFSNSIGNNPQVICEVVGQESAHAFGLDHEYLCEDPMTYLTGCGPKTFQDVDAPCGTGSPTNCSCGGSTQNSYQRILAIFGSAVPPTPPNVEITSPRRGEVVRPGFKIAVEASDNVAVSRVEVRINGETLAAKTEPPYEFRSPIDLADQTLSIEAIATDDRGDSAADTVEALVGEPCSVATDCNTGETCIDGRCAPFEVEGGLGDDCETDGDCLSGICVEELGVCTEQCDPAAEGCPFGFECVDVSGGGGACFRGEAGCACRLGGRPATPWAPLVLLAFAWLVRRRKTP